MIRNYPIMVEPGDEKQAFGVIVPDLPGCHSAADEEKDIVSNAREAILFHLEALDEIPEASPFSKIKSQAEAQGMYALLIDVDLSKIEKAYKRINVTVPAHALHKIDVAAKKSGKSRSQFLVESALEAI